MRRSLSILVSLFTLVAPLVAQELSMPAIFGDHMVLQRDAVVSFWGRVVPGAEVSLQGGWWKEPHSTTADGEGHWKIRIPSPHAGGPMRIEAQSGAHRLVFEDVWLGEVWVCGGQSNMEWTLGPGVGPGIANWQAEAATADLPGLRFFDVAHQLGMQPAEDCQGEWQVSDPESCRQFSAVGFLFGRRLHRVLGVPVGLIGCHWGGTVAEAWTSEEALRELGDFDGALDELAQRRGAPDQDSLDARLATWWTRGGKRDPGSMETAWARPGFLDQDWPLTALPAAWSGPLDSWDGIVWYRRQVAIPASWKGRTVVLELPPIDDNDTTWFEGVRVGASHADGMWNQPRRYLIPAALVDRVAGAEATLAIRALDTGGAGGFRGDPGAMRLFPDGDEAAAIGLAGPWRWQKGASMQQLGAFPRTHWFHANYPTALHNGMLRTVIPYSIRGAIWYQGESNRTRPRQYQRLFPAMIADWRRLWGQGDFPFYFVQIAPFRYGGDQGQAAALREAQTMTLSVPNTGMAVTMDIGDPGNIHPSNKQDVADRLARWALVHDYGRTGLSWSGPLLRGHRIEPGAVRLTFDHCSQGLRSNDDQPLRNFQIAAADQVWHPAQARIEHRDNEAWSVVVSSPEVAFPVAVRYAWGAADQPNLCNAAGLPAPSFRTDSWPAYPGQAPR